MQELQQQQAQAETTSVSLLDQIVDQGRFGAEQAQRERGRSLIRKFVSEVLEGAIVVRPDTESMLNARIAEIDRLLSLQLAEVMHHPDLQKLEGTWRGLK
jgi:type VI secretion system protein ImpC